MIGKRKHAWGKVFGGTCASRSLTASGSSGSSGPGAGLCELIIYLDRDNVAAYEDDFDISNWWHEHKLTYPILSIMERHYVCSCLNYFFGVYFQFVWQDS
jgi:hypothetical protein